MVGWLVGCRVYGRLSHEGPRPMGGMPSVGVFLTDPSPYLRELYEIRVTFMKIAVAKMTRAIDRNYDQFLLEILVICCVGPTNSLASIVNLLTSRTDLCEINQAKRVI